MEKISNLPKCPDWFSRAVFYEIYPQSFYDTNGDGIGDFQGIIEKLDYVKSIGCNALWLNPCFDSPFKDAGYDVRDYKKVAPRYGTNDDLVRLFAEAHKRGIHVLLDLVPCHTSEEHEWFKKSALDEKNEFSDRFIWTGNCFESPEGLGFVGGESERNGVYALSFFKCQPAINYGFLKPDKPWQQGMNEPGPLASKEAMKDVMRFWLDKGADGFRVDMAATLVKKDDAKRSGTSAIWREVRAMLDKDYPEAALVSEWSEPHEALPAGFHADFLLSNDWGSGPCYKALLRDYDSVSHYPTHNNDKSYFKKDGNHDIHRFLDGYIACYEKIKSIGYISIITGNHDTVRVAYNHSMAELKLAFAFILTMPGVPFIYYGDEIGMRYLPLKTKEGGYYRTGARTPMQWKNGANLGFSNAAKDKLYLPVDESADAPTVEAQEKDAASLLNTVRAINKLRAENPDLQAAPNLEIINAQKGDAPFVYKRGAFVCAVNPAGAESSVKLTDVKLDCKAGKQVFVIGGASFESGALRMGAQSFGIWRVE